MLHRLVIWRMMITGIRHAHFPQELHTATVVEIEPPAPRICRRLAA
jgi:hypothetical protein